MKVNKGITLVALIITIIVMLILAGVIIVSAVADGGIIDRAQTALIENERAEVEDLILASYVYKATASTTINGKLDLPKTAKAIYENLTLNGYEVQNAIEVEENGTTYKTLEVKDDEKIELSIEGNHGNYTGTVEKSGLKGGIVSIEENGNGVPPGNEDEEILWAYVDFWGEGEEELRYIGSSKELELIDDKEVKAYVGTLNDDEELEYDKNNIISVNLSEVPYIFYEDGIEKVTIGKFVKDITHFDGAKEVIILGEFGDVTIDYFDDKFIENVVMEEGIENISELAFSKNDLISVTLPKSIKYIGNMAFPSTKLETINYDGTKEDWEKIEKGTSITYSSNVKIIFNDGTEMQLNSK